MFVYMAGVGLMEKSELKSLLRGTKKKGRGRIVPPPYHDSDLPQGSVPPLESEVEALGLDYLSEVLLGILRGEGQGEQLQSSAAKAEAVVSSARSLLIEASGQGEGAK